ncbi:MAG: hypothetical protein LBV02_07515 [Bacteroidales bacterium]|jgi:hypothetical protein|nr:hypothetical protein [Bacteroidales bacterium]
MKKKLMSLSSSLFSKEDLGKINGGLKNYNSDASGDDECSSSLTTQDTPDCMDVFTGLNPTDTVQTTTDFDDVCSRLPVGSSYKL